MLWLRRAFYERMNGYAFGNRATAHPQCRPEDAEDLHPICESRFVMQYNCMKPTTLEAFRARLERDREDDGCLHIELKQSGRVVGMIGVQEDQLRYQVDAVTIDYYLGEAYARQGYMTEALAAVMKQLFAEKNVELISARVFGENEASAALLRKLGFVQEGTLRKGVRSHDGIAYPDRLFSILREEYMA